MLILDIWHFLPWKTLLSKLALMGLKYEWAWPVLSDFFECLLSIVDWLPACRWLNSSIEFDAVAVMVFDYEISITSFSRQKRKGGRVSECVAATCGKNIITSCQMTAITVTEPEQQQPKYQQLNRMAIEALATLCLMACLWLPPALPPPFLPFAINLCWEQSMEKKSIKVVFISVLFPTQKQI